MSHHNHKDGLYSKTESPVTSSVKQTEGLYKKTETMNIDMSNLSDDEKLQLKTIKESAESSNILKS